MIHIVSKPHLTANGTSQTAWSKAYWNQEKDCHWLWLCHTNAIPICIECPVNDLHYNNHIVTAILLHVCNDWSTIYRMPSICWAVYTFKRPIFRAQCKVSDSLYTDFNNRFHRTNFSTECQAWMRVTEGFPWRQNLLFSCF